MNKFDLTKEDFESMQSAYDLTTKQSLTTEDKDELKSVLEKYNDVVKKMQDGRVAKGYKFSDEEITFTYQHGRLAYTLYNSAI